MSYRPICDTWILGRPKVKYYGAYPNGFLERALPLVGASTEEEVLHLCGGRVKDYPNKRLVKHAFTVDADPSLAPDVVADLSLPVERLVDTVIADCGWRACLIDPPYTEADHEHYDAGGKTLPSANHLLRLGLRLVEVGGRVGMLHYVWPQPPKYAKSIAMVGVVCGFNNRIRAFSVFERLDDGEGSHD